MGNDLLCGLEIGSCFLRAAVAKQQKNILNVLGYESIKTAGIENGRIVDLSAFLESMHFIIHKLQNNLNKQIKKIVLGINGDFIEAKFSPAAVAFSHRTNRYIRYSDIELIRRQSVLLGLNFGQKLLHEFPQEFLLDEDCRTNNPVGLLARKIAIKSLLLTAPHSLIDNLINAVEQIGFEVEGIFFSPFVSSLVVLNQDQIKNGAVLLDIGANVTNILFFKDQILKDFVSIHFGGECITQEISKQLNIPLDLAEDLKKSYLVFSSQRDNEFDNNIVIKTADSYKTIQRSQILQATKSKIDTFLQSLKDVFESRIYRDNIKCDVVAVGGCSYLEGFLEKIEEIIALSVGLGRLNIHSSTGETISTDYSAAIGLILYYLKTANNSYLKAHSRNGNLFTRTANFFYRIYHNYF